MWIYSFIRMDHASWADMEIKYRTTRMTEYEKKNSFKKRV